MFANLSVVTASSANLDSVTLASKILVVVTASLAIVTTPVLAIVTSPLTATEAKSVPSPTKIFPFVLASNKVGASEAPPTNILPCDKLSISSNKSIFFKTKS